MKLYIGNKNYSSWSLRSWLLMREAGIPFEEHRLRLEFEPTSAFKQALAPMTPTGKVPLLIDEGFAVWDTLAIAEYLAENFSDKTLWPIDRFDRARARSLCAEMHGGFTALRNHCPMNIEAALPDVGDRLMREEGAVADDLRRISAMWGEALGSSGGPFLFGEFGIVDAYFAPVCSRITTYGLPVSASLRGYVERMLALPAMQAWSAEARSENDFIEADEPYRSR